MKVKCIVTALALLLLLSACSNTTSPADSEMDVINNASGASSASQQSAEYTSDQENASTAPTSESASPVDAKNLFDETYWYLNVGPGQGGSYYSLFHADGTYSYSTLSHFLETAENFV